MDAPSSPPPELVDHGEQLWSSLFPKRPTTSAPPPAAPVRRFERVRARFWRALPGFFEHLGVVIPGLVVAVLTGVLLGYLLGVVREGAQAALRGDRQATVQDRHERDLVRVKAASEQEREPVRRALDAARAEASGLRQLTDLYEGFRTAQRALRALEARQLGEAEATLHEAARQLAPLSGKVDGLAPILQRMQRAQLAAAIDLNVKRRALLATLAQLDALIGARRVGLTARASD